jgi:hypothetical protein
MGKHMIKTNIGWLVGLVLLLISPLLMAQDLKQHQWKDRLVVIFTDDRNADRYLEQISLLKAEKEGMEERKLVVYSFCIDSYRMGLEPSDWIIAESEDLQELNSDAPFEVLLIGLDGSVKLRQPEVLDTNELFSRIDAMPMRQQELRNQQ